MKHLNLICYRILPCSFCLLFIFNNVCLGQRKNVPGYYLTRNSDTVRGTFISYADRDFNSDKIAFLQQEGKKEEMLTPDNCVSLHIEGYDDYISFTGERLINPTSLSTAIHEPDSAKKYEPVKTFLRILFKNEKFLLLKYKDKLRSNYYVQKYNEPPTELIFYQYNDFSGSVVEKNIFRNQLQHLVIDYILSNQQIMNDLESLSYNDANLVGFLSKTTGLGQGKQIKDKRLQFFVTLGVNATSVKDDNITYKLSNSILPFVGFGFIDYSRRNFGRAFFSMALKVYYINSSSEGGTTYLKSLTPGIYISPGYYIIHKVKINWYAALAIGGITSFNKYRAGNNGYIKIEKEMKTNLLIAPETGISFNKRTDLFLNYNLLPKSVAIYSYKLSSLNLGVNYKLHK